MKTYGAYVKLDYSMGTNQCHDKSRVNSGNSFTKTVLVAKHNQFLYNVLIWGIAISYTKPSLIQLQLIRIEIWKILFTVEYIL
jgi:hypothetical protein